MSGKLLSRHTFKAETVYDVSKREKTAALYLDWDDFASNLTLDFVLFRDEFDGVAMYRSNTENWVSCL